MESKLRDKIWCCEFALYFWALKRDPEELLKQVHYYMLMLMFWTSTCTQLCNPERIQTLPQGVKENHFLLLLYQEE